MMRVSLCVAVCDVFVCVSNPMHSGNIFLQGGDWYIIDERYLQFFSQSIAILVVLMLK